MTKVILSGCRGRMGRVIAELVQNDSEIEIVAGFDPGAGAKCDFPVYANPMEYSGTADCVIDFSSPLAWTICCASVPASKSPLCWQRQGTARRKSTNSGSLHANPDLPFRQYERRH